MKKKSSLLSAEALHGYLCSKIQCCSKLDPTSWQKWIANILLEQNRRGGQLRNIVYRISDLACLFPEPILPFSVMGIPVKPWVLFTVTTSSTCTHRFYYAAMPSVLWKELFKNLGELFNYLGELFKYLGKLFKFFGGIIQIFGGIIQIFSGIIKVFWGIIKVFRGIIQVFGRIIQVFGEIFKCLGEIFKCLGELFKCLGELFKYFWGNI